MKIRGQVVHSPIDRLARLSKLDPATGCINWTGSTRNGYGRLIVGSRSDGSRRSVSAHRYSYEIHTGIEIAHGMEVCHRCDNPRCINADHLFVGTKQDNVDDRERKGRNKVQRGERVGTAKLTADLVLFARQLRLERKTFKEIAGRLGVDKKTVIEAVKGITWAHVPFPTPPAITNTGGTE